jgi:hypothetical protein
MPASLHCGEMVGLAGAGEREASHNAAEILSGKATLIERFHCCVKNCYQALIEAESDIGRTGGSLAEPFSRCGAQPRPAARASTVDPE